MSLPDEEFLFPDDDVDAAEDDIRRRSLDAVSVVSFCRKLLLPPVSE
jgi:hypothetical protein